MQNRKLKFNILDTELIRIDFMKIINLEDKIVEIIPYLKEIGYELDEGVQNSDNVERIKDPEPLITQDIMEKTNKDKITYTFVKEDEKITINEYVLIFEKFDFKNYSTIEKPLKTLDKILKILIKDENINYQRIGIRKTNSIILKANHDINDIFKEINTNQIDDNEPNVTLETKKVVTAEEISYNQSSTVRSGMARIRNKDEELIEECKAYMISLDLDYYSRNLSNYDNEKIMEKLKILNDKLYEAFRKQITEEFFEKLQNGENDFQNYGIMGGINECNQN